MGNDGRIDSDLFDLFLTSGVFEKYAKWNLKKSQIDQVDIAKFISRGRSEAEPYPPKRLVYCTLKSDRPGAVVQGYFNSPPRRLRP